jgi:O-succinylbenzoic acid--CoA ligase
MQDWLRRAAALHPDRVAIERSDGGGVSARLTYEELLEAASAAARGLAADGVAAGQRLPIPDRDRLKFAAQLHGALLHGAAAVPLDPRLSEQEQAARSASGVEVAGVAAVMFTSGTTSAPKPVPLTEANFQANAVGSALALGLDPAERWLCTMPLAHVGGLTILLRSTLYATTVVAHERFDTEAVLADLMNASRRITLVSLVPTMLARLLDAGLRNPPTLRWALVSGAPLTDSLLARAGAAGVPIAPSYGLTETCSQMVTFGLPLLGGELRLEETGGAIDGPDTVHGDVAQAVDGPAGPRGEIAVHGPMVATSALDADGWLRTGDLGELDERGRLRVIGRKSEMIVSGGENIAPSEVEEVLLAHPGVADAGVFGRPDDEWGEAVIAKVVPRPGVELDVESLREFAARRLARFKLPKQVLLAEVLPRTASGKLLRRELR